MAFFDFLDKERTIEGKGFNRLEHAGPHPSC